MSDLTTEGYKMAFYPDQQEAKIDYMKIMLQGLIALLLVSLIILAWSVRSWLLSRAEQNLAEHQTAPAATLDAALKANAQQQPLSTSPAAPPQIVLAATQPVPAPQAPVPAPVAVAQPPVAAPVPPRQEAKVNNAVLTTTLDQALASLEQQSAARQIQPPAIDPQAMSAAKPATKEDAAYVNALAVQYQDRGKPTVQLSDEELAKRISAGTQSQVSQGKAVDTTNKVLILAAANGQGYQGELDALVAASLQRIKDEKAGIAAPAVGYLQGLQQEASLRGNEARTYVVQAGDTLSHIAARSYGSAGQYMKIYRANPTLITDPNRIFIGQVLRVPL